jgi:hypothetical protein
MTRQLENINIFKNKSIQGGQEMQIYTGTQGGTKFSSYSFDGAVVSSKPKSQEIILVAGWDVQGGIYDSSRKLPNYVEEGIASGKYKIVKLLDPEEFPFGNFKTHNPNNEMVTYVITDALEQRPLSVKQVSSRNIVWDVDHAYAIKQAKTIESKILGKSIYLDDQLVAAIAQHGQGKAIVERLEAVRLALKRGSEADAKLLSKGLPWNWEDVKKKFNASVDSMGRQVPAEFNVNIPFMLTKRNIKTI